MNIEKVINNLDLNMSLKLDKEKNKDLDLKSSSKLDTFKKMKNTDEVFMDYAIDQAKKAYCLRETPIGAIIVKDGHILARAFNMTETFKDPTAHAEIMAIRKASANSDYWRLFDTTMYLTLEPCPMCVGAIINAKIKRLVIGGLHKKNAKVDKELKLSYDLLKLNKVEVSFDVKEESSILLNKFFSDLRNKKY